MTGKRSETPSDNGKRQPRPSRAAAPSRGLQTVGAFMPRIAAAAFQAHGFPSAAILAEWPTIAGTDLASFTAPERLIWPRRARDHAQDQEDQTTEQSRQSRHSRRSGATLVLRVQGPRALEVQYAAAQLIERVNSYFGYGAVAQMRIVQGPVRHKAAAPKAPTRLPAAAPPPQIDGIDNEALRDALARLGASLPVSKT